MSPLALNSVSRRQCLQTLASTTLLTVLHGTGAIGSTSSLPRVRAITKGPGHHWFGYYDKHEFDVTGRFVLGMRVSFEHRLPERDDVIEVGMVDLKDKDRWIRLGESRTWSWQQGCMLQWIPESATKVLWNDRIGDRMVCRILDVTTGEQQEIPHPIYTLFPDGRRALSTDFRRLRNLRPDTGYAGLKDPFADVHTPTETGIWRVDLTTGNQQLLLSYADIANFGEVTKDMQDTSHWIEHLALNPSGTRFTFLHRWRPSGDPKAGFRTRMFTASANGEDLYVIDPSGRTSHTAWRDEEHVLAYTQSQQPIPGRRFCLFKDRVGEVEVVGKDTMLANGHCTFLPGGKWLLNDTYPDKARLQHPYLYHTVTDRIYPLGHYYSPPEYIGPVRCDTHPRLSRDAKSVVFDSPHGGNGRQMYLADIADIVG